MSNKVAPADTEPPIPKDMAGKVVRSSEGPLAAPQSEGFHDMGDGWKLYVESWRLEQPRAVFVFHHGACMSSSGCAEGRRLGHALNATGIELWSFDMHGCGYSIDKLGKRVRRGTTEGTRVGTRHFLALCEALFVPRAKALGVPLVACGHSFGGAVVMMATEGLLQLCNCAAVRFPLALYIDPACCPENACLTCCCGGCGRCCRAYGPGCCNFRMMKGAEQMGFAYLPPEAEVANAEGVALPPPGPGDCLCCDALYLACGRPAAGGWPDPAWARLSAGVHIKEPNRPKIIFLLCVDDRHLADSAKPVWKAASEGGTEEDLSNVPEWLELPGVQHMTFSDTKWKQVLHETLVPKVEAALGNAPEASTAPQQEAMAKW